MSPRGSSSVNAAASTNSNRAASSSPYSRRPAGQPKSSRQQFSACGACRMRRVRCDLKDLPFSSAIPHPSCSNCKERNVNCVDEFADVKAVKLLRRGRRLQQVEAIYGKITDLESPSSSSLSPTHLENKIPLLQLDFFTSPFWRWFSMQRPIIDPTEFPARFLSHSKGTQALSPEGRLLAMLLVVWAASFGVNEYGISDKDDADGFPSHEIIDIPQASGSGGHSTTSITSHVEGDVASKQSAERRKGKRDTTDAMLREILELIDLHGVMRRPTWDGVRVLLLVMPLMEEANPLDRLTMHEAALSQVYGLCSLPSSPAPPSSMHAFSTDDASVRARIFWYAYVQDSVTTGLRGGRLVLSDDDFDLFHSTLPTLNYGVGSTGVSPPTTSSAFSSVSPPMFTPIPHLLIHPAHSHPQQHDSPTQSYVQTAHLFSLPLRLSAVCRRVHTVLTGPRATRRVDDGVGIDSEGMREVWAGLDRCWEEFGAVRNGIVGVSEEDAAEIERFVSAWQIVIFECHNHIRESLISMSRSPSAGSPTQSIFPSTSPPPRPPSHSSTSSTFLSPSYLHTHATRKCLQLLPSVLSIIKQHLSIGERDRNSAGLFRWDAGLVRDGCFFAGFLVASGENDVWDVPAEDKKLEGMDGVRRRMSAEDGVDVCLKALKEMRWTFSKSEGMEETIRMAWEARKTRRRPHYQGHAAIRPQELEINYHNHHQPYSDFHAHSRKIMRHATLPADSQTIVPPLGNRSPLPPLNLAHSHRRTLVNSAPNTAYSTSGNGVDGWPSYTPPGTGTSATTSASTGMSGDGSPEFSNILRPSMHAVKNGVTTNDSFYHVAGEVDQFSFSAPGAESSSMSNAVAYHPRSAAAHSHPMHSDASSSYLDTGATFTPMRSSAVHTGPDDTSGNSHFTDDCNTFYQ